MNGTCEDCADFVIVHRRKHSGRTTCDYCNRRDTAKWRQCCVCGEVKWPGKVEENGRAICKRCWPKHGAVFEKCSGCDKVRQVWKRDADKNPICRHCRSAINKKNCYGCYQFKGIVARGLCKSCYCRWQRLRATSLTHLSYLLDRQAIMSYTPQQ